MVVVKIGDGMGNQLYNYACGYASARRDGDTLMLDISECDNSTLRDFELDNFHIKYDAKESFPNGTLWQKVYKRLRRDIKYHVLKEKSVYAPGKKNHTPANVDMRVFKKKRFRNKYLHGYWQNTVYFKEYLDEICGMLNSWCDSTRWETGMKPLKSTMRKSRMSEHQKQEALYEKRFREGGCTLGDMNHKRHRNTYYINSFPCGTKCPHCGTFWID